MTKAKKFKRKEIKHVLGEVHFIVPARNKGFPSDARALVAISELNKQKPLDLVAADQGQVYSLVHGYCVKYEIDFFSRGQNIRQNPNCIDELLELYQPKEAYSQKKLPPPNIAYLTRSDDYKTLSAIAENLDAKGVKTEIRKVF